MLSLLIIMLIQWSCSKDFCPTYMNSIERIKSIRGQNPDTPDEESSVPSPYYESKKKINNNI